MKIKRSVLLSAVAILLITNIITLVILIGDGKGSDSIDAASETVATVGGEEISREDWLHTLEEKYGKQELKSLVNQKVIERLAEENGIKVTKEEINKEFELIQSVYNTYDEEMLLDEDTVRNQLKAELLLEKILTKDVEVEEEKLLSYYEENEELYHIPAMYKLSQIVVATKKDGKQVIKELKNGSSFNVLAMEHSLDKKSAPLGGEIGYVPVDSGYLSEGAIIELEKVETGKWTSPLPVDGQYVIYQVKDKTEEKDYSFDEVKQQIRRRIALEQIGTPLQAEDFWEEVGVEWFYGKKH